MAFPGAAAPPGPEATGSGRGGKAGASGMCLSSVFRADLGACPALPKRQAQLTALVAFVHCHCSSHVILAVHGLPLHAPQEGQRGESKPSFSYIEKHNAVELESFVSRVPARIGGVTISGAPKSVRLKITVSY